MAANLKYDYPLGMGMGRRGQFAQESNCRVHATPTCFQRKTGGHGLARRLVHFADTGFMDPDLPTDTPTTCQESFLSRFFDVILGVGWL